MKYFLLTLRPYYFLLFIVLYFSSVYKSDGQVSQFPQVYYNGQGSNGYNLNIKSVTGLGNGSVLTTLPYTSKIGGESISTYNGSYGIETWVKVCLPATSGNISYGHMLYGEYYARIDEANNYAKVTGTGSGVGLNIRTGPGTNYSIITISGSNAKYGDNSIIALTGTTSGNWYQVYLPNSCSQTTGYVSGSYLNVASSQSYYNIAGSVQESGTGYYIWGATTNFGSIGSTYSSEGFYQYKLPTSWSGNITCTHPNYNTSSPASYSYSASSHTYNKDFLLSNAATISLSGTLGFGNVQVGSSSQLDFKIDNTGSATMNVTSINFPSGFSGNWSSGSISAGNSKTVTVTFSPSSVSSYGGTITVYSDASSGNNTINCSGSGISTCTSPSVVYDPSDYQTNSGNSAYFDVTASGTSLSYQWKYNTGSGWNDVPSSYPYSGTATNYLSISSVSNSMDGYLYKCNISNNCNGQNSLNSNYATLTVNNPQPPVADFYVYTFGSYSSNIYAGSYLKFYDKSKYSATQWEWTFYGGSPSSSTSQNPSVTYNTPGKYMVRLKAINAQGDDTKTITGYVTVQPSKGHQVIPPLNYCTKDDYNSYRVADPIQISTGTYKLPYIDFEIPAIGEPLLFKRCYNSSNYNIDGPLGYGWSHTFSHIFTNFGDTLWQVSYPDGHRADFIPRYDIPGSSFPLYGGTSDSVYMDSYGVYILVTKEQIRYFFNSNGKLDHVTDANNSTTTLYYTGVMLDSVVAAGGRALTLTCDSITGKILSVNSPLGLSCNYRYENGDLVSVQNPKLDSTNYTYDTSHQLLSINNTLRITILTNVYDTNHRIISQADANGKNTYISYDIPSFGDATILQTDSVPVIVHHDSFYVLTKIDISGITKSFTHDDNFNFDTIMNENNEIETRQYDSKSNLIYQKPTGIVSSSISYNNFSKPVTISNSIGSSIDCQYDNNGNPISIHFPDNSIRNYGYNSDGTMSYSLSGTFDSTFYYYNSYGDFIKIAAPHGNRLFSYDADGRPISYINENSDTFLINYDSNGNITSIQDPLGYHFSYTYDNENQLISFTNKKGYTTYIGYDRKGRRIYVQNPAGGIDSLFYDFRDRVILYKNAIGDSISNKYDSLGRQISQTNALGTEQYFYDGLGNILKAIDGVGRVSTSTYKFSDNTRTIADGLGNTDTYDYDSLGNPISFANALNFKTQYQFDNMLRLSALIMATYDTTRYGFDDNGDMDSLTDGNGNVQVYSYDASQRFIKHHLAAGGDYIITRDGVGNILNLQKPSGSISQEYDALSRPTKRVVSSGDSSSYTYDANNNMSSMTNSLGTSYMGHNRLDLLDTFTDQYNKVVIYGYNKGGQNTSVTYPNNQIVNNTFNGVDLIDSVIMWNNKTISYEYDASGREIKQTYPSGMKCISTYDSAGRLTDKYYIRKNGDTIAGTTYILDAEGQRLNINSFSGITPKSIKSSTYSLTYDASDVVQNDSINSFANDSNGSRTSDIFEQDSMRYNFTVDERLLSYIHNNKDTVISGYNPKGDRINRTVSGVETRYVLDISTDLSKVLQTTDNNGIVKRNYIYAGDKLLAQIDSLDKVLYYIFDGQHNTIALVDANDSIVVRYAYDNNGMLVDQVGNISQPYTWLGEHGIEQETHRIYYIRHRYYDAGVAGGRFPSKDPLMGDPTVPLSLNRYIYGLDNPISIYDITGLSGERDHGVGQPGFKESLIPIWGSGRAAIDDFQHGKIGAGLWNSALAVSDVFLVKSIATIGGKLLIKAGGKVLGEAGGKVLGEEGVFTVTKNGVVLPKGAKIPANFIENPNRVGSYGVKENGKFAERLRIDAATPPGTKGPNFSHYHLNGSSKHLIDNWPWW